MMKKDLKKIKNLTIGIITFFILSSHTFKLIKGEKKANNITKYHKNISFHDENIVAHRGLSGYYLDNSYESVENALNLDCVDIIEVDVRITKDNKLILCHDEFIGINNFVIKVENLMLESLDKNTNVINYQHYNFDELFYDDTLFLFKRFLSKSSKETKLIKLDDFTKWYSFEKDLIVDIKTDYVNYEFMKLLDNNLSNYKEFIYIQSDNYFFLEEMAKLYPNYKYLFIIRKQSDVAIVNDNFYGYTIKYSLLDNVNILDDKMYLVYTINSGDKYLKLKENINYHDNMYIVTNNPDYICAISEDKKLRK